MSSVGSRKLTVVQVLPALQSGGVERGTLEVGKYLVDQGHRSIVISDNGRLVGQLVEEGSEHINWAIGRKSLLTFIFIPRLIAFLKKNKVDILHVRSRFPAWICYLALKIMPVSKRPHLVTTVHGTYSINPYSAIMTKGEQVIVISKMIRDYVLNNYRVRPDKLHLNYRGVDEQSFPYAYKPTKEWLDQWYQDFPETRSKQIITLPARITRWKGQEDFIEVIAKLKDKVPNLHGLIVGETKQDKFNFLDDLKNKAKELGVYDQITFTEHRTDLREIMAISNIVMSLSHQPEAFGRTTIEALSLGIPVIGYAHGGVYEQLSSILPEGCVTPGNIDATSALTLKWLKFAPVVPNSSSFTLKKMLETTLSIYQNLVFAKTGPNN